MPDMKAGTTRQIDWLERIAGSLRWYVGGNP
jgi:hypothetical protein